MKILLISDSHGNNSAIDDLKNKYPHMDLYLHAGDSESDSFSISPFQSVLGNCDYMMDYPSHMELPIPGGYLWIQHKPCNNLALLKKNNIRLFCYGHTHHRHYEVIDGITFVNPGAISFPRDGHDLSYAIIEINDDAIKVKFACLQ